MGTPCRRVGERERAKARERARSSHWADSPLRPEEGDWTRNTPLLSRAASRWRSCLRSPLMAIILGGAPLLERLSLDGPEGESPRRSKTIRKVPRERAKSVAASWRIGRHGRRWGALQKASEGGAPWGLSIPGAFPGRHKPRPRLPDGAPSFSPTLGEPRQPRFRPLARLRS